MSVFVVGSVVYKLLILCAGGFLLVRAAFRRVTRGDRDGGTRRAARAADPARWRNETLVVPRLGEGPPAGTPLGAPPTEREGVRVRPDEEAR